METKAKLLHLVTTIEDEKLVNYLLELTKQIVSYYGGQQTDAGSTAETN